MNIEQQILKAVLLLRKFNRYESKEEQLEDAKRRYADNSDALKLWIDSLRTELSKSQEDREKEKKQYIEELCRIEAKEAMRESYDRNYPSCTSGDYGPSCPWNAPGMSIRDFI